MVGADYGNNNMTSTPKNRAAVFICSVLAMSSCAFAQTSEVIVSTVTDPSQPEFYCMGGGDISYISRDDNDEGGFTVGQAVAHASAYLGDRFSVFGEFSLTARDSQYSIEAERLFVKYEFSDAVKLSAGRYHTPIGYWNSAFHHGAWLQTTVSRPEMIRFGSKILPIHFVGALLEGNLPGGGLGLTYMAGIGNGRHSNIARSGDAGDINGDNAWMVQLNASPDNIYGSHFGLGFYSDTVSPTDREDINEQTMSAYIVWSKESPEFLFEYLHSSHEFAANSSISGDTDARYAQLAYRLKDRNRNWKPYLRVESTRVDDSDPLLGDQNLNYDAGIVGVRWDFNPYAALKGEYRNEEFDIGGRENNFRIQVSFVLARL